MAQTATLFVEDDFSAMKFAPKKGKMIDLYPALEEMLVEDTVIRYISFMYDPGSPLRNRFPDLNMRIESARELSGLTDEKQWDFVSSSDEVYIESVTRFLRAVNSRLWTMIVTNEETFYEYAMRALDPVTKDDDSKDKDVLQAANVKTKLLADMDEIDGRLTTYYRRLTGEDNKLAESVRVRRRTPETMAKAARIV